MEFFSFDILTRIFHFLPVQQAKDWALCSKKFYRASRLGSAMNMRWIILDEERLRTILKTFFAHLIEAVEVSKFMTLICLRYARLKLTDVTFQVKKSNDIFFGGDFDDIKRLYFKFVGFADTFELSDFPKNLRVLKFNRMDISEQDEDDIVIIPSKLPETLKTLFIRSSCIKGLVLNNGLEEFTYIDHDCFSNLPAHIPVNIYKLNIQGTSDAGGWNILDDNTVYPNLKKMSIYDFCSGHTIEIRFETRNAPNLRRVAATHLKLINNAKLSMKSFENTADGISYFEFYNSDEEKPNKKIKL